MERTSHDQAPCSIARSADVLGDWWTPLILRECLYGVHRFSELQQWLGIGKNILSRRLDKLVKQGVLEKRPYQDRPVRYEYHLTGKGYDATRVLLALMDFGERWMFDDGNEPIRLYDRNTGRRVKPVIIDANTGAPIDPRSIYAGPGPAFPDAPDVRTSRFTDYYNRGGDDAHD